MEHEQQEEAVAEQPVTEQPDLEQPPEDVEQGETPSESEEEEKLAPYIVVGTIKSGTANVLRLGLVKRGQVEGSLVCDMPFLGQVLPEVYLRMAMNNATVAAQAVGNLLSCPVDVADDKIVEALQVIIGFVNDKAATAIIDSRTGKKVIDCRPDGSIAAPDAAALRDDAVTDEVTTTPGGIILPS